MSHNIDTEKHLEQTMDRKYIDQNNVIERYLLGQLNQSEMDAFEDRFTFDPELYEEIAATEKLIQGLRAVSQNEQDTGPHVTSTSSNQRNTKYKTISKFSIAASITLAITSTALFIENRNLIESYPNTINQLQTPTISFETSRGITDNLPQITQGSGVATIYIDRNFIHNDHTYYLEITDEDMGVILRSEKFQPSTFGQSIEWTIERDVLAKGKYSLSVKNEHETHATYNFLVD